VAVFCRRGACAHSKAATDSRKNSENLRKRAESGNMACLKNFNFFLFVGFSHSLGRQLFSVDNRSVAGQRIKVAATKAPNVRSVAAATAVHCICDVRAAESLKELGAGVFAGD